MKKILFILSIGFLLRIFAIFYFGNLEKDFYWEYGEIAKNLIHGNGYSLFYYDGSLLEYHFKENVVPYKSAYMPPGYVFFLTPFMILKNIVLRNVLILITQNFISVLSIYFLYKLCLKLFSETVAIISALIVSITPEFNYAVLSYTPTVIYHLLVAILFLFILNKNHNVRNAVYIGALTAFIIYFRAEFVLFGLLLIGCYLINKKFNNSIIIGSVIIILLLPWSVRNYLAFHKFIPLTTSFGLNLYRGNNPYNIGDWGDEYIIRKIIANKNDSFEIKMNQIYEDAAFSYMIKNPFSTLNNWIKKLFHFWVIDIEEPREMNIFYLIPAFSILLFFIYGLVKRFSWDRYQYFYLFFIYSSLIIVFFFPMLRYQTMMKIAMVPFCAYGISRLNNYGYKFFLES